MILALHTADKTAQIWLIPSAAGPVGRPTIEWDSGRELSDQLLDVIAGQLHQAGHQLDSLTGFIIFSGPGSFTSLRIGHATVNALADSLAVPVVGAQGEDWIQAGLKALINAKPGRPALPHYGSEARITRPKA